MADDPLVGGIPVSGDDIEGEGIAQRVKITVGPDGTGGAARDMHEGLPLPVGGATPVQIVSGTEAWANEAAANYENTTDLTISGVNPGRLLLVIVKNPSTVTALTGKIKHKYTDPNGGATRYATLSTPAGIDSFAVASNNGDGQAFLVDGGLLAAGGRLSLSNDTVLGVSDGFTASVQVYALCAI